MRPLRLMLAGVVGVALVGCQTPLPPPVPHYQLGGAYQAGLVWFYPRESYGAVETGLAGVASARHGPRTADGEAYDATAMAVGHQTLQLPAIARLTNLENGVQVVVRINDRGPAQAARLVELTPRAAALLGVPAAGGTQVRLEVLEAESRAAVEGLAGAPRLAIATAPRGEVRSESLDAPGATAVAAAAQAEPAVAPAAPARLPETVTRTSFGPGDLYIRLGSFSRAEFAERQRARAAGLGAQVLAERNGRQTTYRLRIGPLGSVARADATLEQAIRAGITDARIVVE